MLVSDELQARTPETLTVDTSSIVVSQQGAIESMRTLFGGEEEALRS